MNRALARRRPSDWALIAVLLAAAVYAGYLARHMTFFYDEWSFIFDRRGWSLLTFLAPHNQHWSTVPVLIYKLLFLVLGMRSYAPYIAVAIVLYLAIVVVAYALLKPRLGGWAALGVAALLAFLGRGAEDILWAFQIGYNLAILGGLIAIYCARSETSTPLTRRRRLGIALALLASVMSSSIGLFFLVALGVELAFDKKRRAELRAVVPVVVIYALWFALFHKSSVDQGITTLASGNFAVQSGFHIPDGVSQLYSFIPYGVGASVAGLFGLTGWWTWPGLVAYLLFVVILWRRTGTNRPRLLAAVVGLVIAFAVTGIGRAQAGADYAASPRYLHFGVALVILTVSSGDLRDWFARWRWPMLAIFVAGILSGAYQLHQYAVAKDEVMSRQKAELQTVLALRGTSAMEMHAVIDRDVMPQVTASQYYAAVDALGNPLKYLSAANLDQLPSEDVQRVKAALFPSHSR